MKKKLCCLALTLCSGITLICAGLLDTSGSRIAYVALPYVSLFLPTAFCLTGSVRFSMGGRRLEFAAYDKSINRIHRSAIGQIMIGSIAAAGDIFYLLYNKKMEKPLAEFVFLGSMFIMMILGILTLRILKIKPYEAEELKKDDTEM